MEAPSSKSEMIEAQLRATARVSFDAFDTFAALESELRATAMPTAQARVIARKSTTFRSPRTAQRYPNFRTLPRADDSAALKAEAARKNDAIRTPYSAPSDHRFRIDSPPSSWIADETDFVAKFTLPSNQDIRRRTALDQEGFFGLAQGEDLLPVSIRFQQAFDQQQQQQQQQQQCRTTPQPTFQSRVPHTARKSSNIELRLEKILDQEGLLPELQEIRSHKYRDEATSATPFDTKFKPKPSYKPLASAETTARRQSTSNSARRPS